MALKQGLERCDGLWLVSLIAGNQGQVDRDATRPGCKRRLAWRCRAASSRCPWHVVNGAVAGTAAAGSSGRFSTRSSSRRCAESYWCLPTFAAASVYAVSGVVRLLARRPGERRLRVVEEIHSQAHSTESQKDLRVLGLELLRAAPGRERPLQFADALCDPAACCSVGIASGCSFSAAS